MTGGGTSKGLSGKSNGTYGYRVQACNVGGCSGWSSTRSISVLLPPATPAAPSLSVIPPDTKPTINATWSAVSTATEYQLQETAPSGSVYSVYDGGATSWAQAQLTGGEYRFTLRACNSSGCSGWSATASIYVTVSGGGLPGP